MKNWLPVLILPTLVMAFSAIADVGDDRNQCKEQAEQILARLQTEVQMEQAVQEARDEEQEKASSWLTESANKPGNKRLKRKGY